MTESLEMLQTMDQHVEYVVQLLTQAEQTLEQVHAWAEEYQANTPNPPQLIAAISTIRGELASATNRHNELLGQIRMAQHDAVEQAGQQLPDNPYANP